MTNHDFSISKTGHKINSEAEREKYYLFCTQHAEREMHLTASTTHRVCMGVCVCLLLSTACMYMHVHICVGWGGCGWLGKCVDRDS